MFIKRLELIFIAVIFLAISVLSLNYYKNYSLRHDVMRAVVVY